MVCAQRTSLTFFFAYCSSVAALPSSFIASVYLWRVSYIYWNINFHGLSNALLSFYPSRSDQCGLAAMIMFVIVAVYFFTILSRPRVSNSGGSFSCLQEEIIYTEKKRTTILEVQVHVKTLTSVVREGSLGTTFSQSQQTNRPESPSEQDLNRHVFRY